MTRSAIICVDDEEIILNSLSEQLKRNIGREYNIELASSGLEALEICAELEAEGIAIALVISDRVMPQMSGDEFLIKLHDNYPKTLKILLTGQTDVYSLGNIVNAAELYRYITKPWDETDLILTVKEALKRYGQEEQLVKQNILLQQTNDKLVSSYNLLLSTFEAIADGIFVLDNRGRILAFNQQFLALWDIDAASFQQDINYLLFLFNKALIDPLICNLSVITSPQKSQKYELLKLNNGKILESYFQTQELAGKIVGLVWGFRDVTERERVKHQAIHDTLTQLPKHSILTCQLAKAISQAEKDPQMLVAVMFVDLDRFKEIGDTFGHQTSDRLLQEVVQRLKQCLREDDIIARWSRSEFTLLLPKVRERQNIDAIVKRILDVLKTPFRAEGKPIHINVNIGIAMYPEHGLDAESILKNAGAALSQTQRLNVNNYQYYDFKLSSQTRELLTLENSLHSALSRNEFFLHYQPIVDITTGKIVKMEALLRWKNPNVGLVPPYIFIPLAEKNGAIVSIGQWVLETACQQNKIWQEMGLMPIKISVNLSVRQFHQANLVATIASTLDKTQLAPNYLELEITESITMQDTNLALKTLIALDKLGISLSMDDFGTGYSSLSYLQQFPFHTLKIDRSFIKDLSDRSTDVAIVEAIIALGKGLNLNVVVEGVETEQLKELLRNMGCKYIQGYLFSKPLPAGDATEFLKQNQLF